MTTTAHAARGTPAAGNPSDTSKPATGWFAMLKQTASDWMEDKAMRLAAALALYAILSLGPLLVITLKVISLFLDDKVASGQLDQQLNSLLGPEAAAAVKPMIEANTKPGAGVLATVISSGLLLFTATGVIGELQDSMNTIWEVKPRPNMGIWGFIRTRLLSAGMVLGIAFLLLTSMFVSTLITTMAKAIAGENAWIGYPIDIVVSLAVVTVLFAAIFKFLPDVKIEWRDVWVGAAFTAGLFVLGKYLLAIYFAKAAPQSAYGAAGSLVAVLLWVYYSSMILFFGAEFTQVWVHAHGRRITPDKHAVPVTDNERAQQGLVSAERMQKAMAGELQGAKRTPHYTTPAFAANAHKSVAGPGPRPDPHPHRTPTDFAIAAGGIVAGAVIGALGVEYLLHDPKRPTRKHLAAVRVDERLATIEQKLGRVSRIREYLDDMSVKERIDRVEQDIRHAGRHVRANETGRPLWAVRLADLIGGRWSNL